MDYDLAVVGSGPGGYVAAIRAAQYGMKVAVIERDDVGGACLNRGCIPTKSIMHAAHLYQEMQHSAFYGLQAELLDFDIEKIYENKDDTVEKLKQGIEQLFAGNKVTLIKGNGVITGPNRIEVTGEGPMSVQAEKVLVAVGSKPALLPEKLQNHPNVFTSDEALSGEQKLHQRIIIIGGGVIGVEFASIYRAFGCDVTIIEALPKLLPPMDKEISQNLSMILKKRGVQIITSAAVESISETADGLLCGYKNKEQLEKIECDGILVSIGRKPNTGGVFGGGMDISMDRGFITVDENFQTSIPSIYAIGDCIKGIQLAHAASAQGLNAAAHMNGREMAVQMKAVPACVYTDPEIACVGITEKEAEAQGIAVATGKYLMTGNAKSMLSNQERGFIKVVTEKDSGVILGAQLMCARATDIISEFTTAIVHKLTAEDLAGVIRPHPTFTEGVTEAVEDVLGSAVHILPKRR